MRAGCSMSDSTAPSDSASVNSRVSSTTASAAASPPARRRSSPCRRSRASASRPTSWPGCIGQARVQHPSTRPGARPASRRSRARVLAVAVHAHRERLDAAQHEVAVERRRHRADRVLHEPELRRELVVVRRDEAADDVGVTAEVLRARVHDDVGARARAAAAGTASRTCCRRRPAHRARARPRATAAMSTTVSSGIGRRLDPHDARLVAPRRLERVRVGEVDRGPRRCPRARTPCSTAGTCRRTRRSG